MEEKCLHIKHKLFNDSLFKFPQPQDWVWGVKCIKCGEVRATRFDKKTAKMWIKIFNK